MQTDTWDTSGQLREIERSSPFRGLSFHLASAAAGQPGRASQSARACIVGAPWLPQSLLRSAPPGCASPGSASHRAYKDRTQQDARHIAPSPVPPPSNPNSYDDAV